jgi:hypothetical protein
VAVIGAIGVATHSSSAASPSRSRSRGGVVVTPRLKRALQSEILVLRSAQPRGPLVFANGSRAQAPGSRVPRVPLIPERGVPCFVAGGAACPEIPCQWFASAPAPAVYTTSSTVTVAPGTRRKVGAGPAASCKRRAPRKLVLVAGP